MNKFTKHNLTALIIFTYNSIIATAHPDLLKNSYRNKTDLFDLNSCACYG